MDLLNLNLLKKKMISISWNVMQEYQAGLIINIIMKK